MASSLFYLLVFSAHARAVEKGSWYLWNAEEDPVGKGSGCYTIFPIKYGESSRPENYVPDEVGIGVVGNFIGILKVGYVVEMPLHIIEGIVYDPCGPGHIWVEGIRELKIAVRSEDLKKIS